VALIQQFDECLAGRSLDFDDPFPARMPARKLGL
jgi:hypothetical protein